MPRMIFILALLTLSCSETEQRVLNLYTSLDAQEAPVYIRAFEEETGIRVQWSRLSAGEALARIEAEKHNPQVSVWFGGPSPEYIVAAQRGLLQPFAPELSFELDAPARGDSSMWTGFYFGAIGFACNEEFLRARSVRCP